MTATARRRPGDRPRGRAAAAGRAPGRLRPGAALRVRGRGRAALPRLDLVSQHPRALGRGSRRAWPSASSRSSRARGKMHNPETDSGGVALGTVTEVGERYGSPPRAGQRIVTLASLTLTPLRLERGRPGSTPTTPRSRSPAPPTSATARPGARCPRTCRSRPCSRSTTSTAPARSRATLAPDTAAPSACSAPATPASWRMAAARDAMDGGTVVAVDVDAAAIARVRELGLCDIGVTADLRDPLAARRGAARGGRAAGRPDRGRRQRQRAASRPRSCSRPTPAPSCSSRWPPTSRPPR